MTRLDENTIAEVLLNAPDWALVGITAPAAWLRRSAAIELARAILASEPTEIESECDGQRQIAL